MVVNNQGNEVVFQKLEDIKNSVPLDWSGKVNQDFSFEFLETSENYAKSNKFTFEKDDKYPIKEADGFGDGSFALPSGRLREKEFYNSPFAYTANNIMFYSASGGIWAPHLPMFNSDINQTTDPTPNESLKPRLLYFAGEVNLSEVSINAFITGIELRTDSTDAFPFVVTKFGKAFSDPNGWVNGLTKSIQFGNSESLFDGAVKSDMKTLIELISNNNVIKGVVHFTYKDYLQFDPLRKVYIQELNGYFIVNKIEQLDFNRSRATVELIKI